MLPTPPIHPALRVLLLGDSELSRALADQWTAGGAVVTRAGFPSLSSDRSDPMAAAVAARATASVDAVSDASVEAVSHASVEAVSDASMDAVVCFAESEGDAAPPGGAPGALIAAAQSALHASRAHGARALCWISSSAVYGERQGGEATELESREGSDHAYAEHAAAEDVILAGASASCAVGVLRVATVYGPGHDPTTWDFAGEFSQGAGDRWLNLVWRDDVVAAIRAWTAGALEPGGAPAIVNVADGTPLTVSECARITARALGRDLAQLGARATIPLHATVKLPATLGAGNHRVRVTRLRELGWVPAAPHLSVGLLLLGHARLRPGTKPYGPQTDRIRRFLQRVAELTPRERSRIHADWLTVTQSVEFSRSDRALAECMVRSGREAERDAAAGPLLHMLQGTPSDAVVSTPSDTVTGIPSDTVAGSLPSNAPSTPTASDAKPEHEPGSAEAMALDPSAEPLLAAVMVLVVEDLLHEPARTLLTDAVRDWLAD